MAHNLRSNYKSSHKPVKLTSSRSIYVNEIQETSDWKPDIEVLLEW